MKSPKGAYMYNRLKAIDALKRDDPDKYKVFQAEDEERKRRQREAQKRQRQEMERIRREQEEARQRAIQRREHAMQVVPASHAAMDPVGFYAKYRRPGRRFILHVGPTNSGKTHDALEALRTAGSGAYLAPLRLLALEVGETLRESGVPCSIITGEEQSLMAGAMHVAETVELADLTQSYDVAVIDEAQMMADPDRGGAWTRAILGLDAPIIHVCTSPNAVPLLRKLIDWCGDRMEIVRHERQTPLTVEDEPFDGTPQQGDAIIAFSRKQVIATAAALEDKGITTSVIYGALPWSARRFEAKRFRTGESKVLVATDAIGMGLNLPIRRIVFSETVKYDGYSERPLTGDEVKQIAGRAGRLGMFDQGLVTGMDGKSTQWLKTKLDEPYAPLPFISLAFPRELGMDIDANLTDILTAWSKAPTPDPIMHREDLSNAMLAADLTEETESELDLHLYRVQELGLAFTTANLDNEHDYQEFNDLLYGLENMNEPGWTHDMLPNPDDESDWHEMFGILPDSLRYLEYRLHSLGIRYSFAKAMDLMDSTMTEQFRQTRERLELEVIEKVSGSKNALVERRVQRAPRRSYDDYWYDNDYDNYDDDFEVTKPITESSRRA
ncbi:helicase-related protein [Bifidobacterium callitrichidarum]|uniref:helicase-related protein n=1 Tax=Bifidobacterium callitrichidarum TaxID=2052941 RepID=UPI001304B6F5|nr:helicase-related protein [Bifidobacterium callitrichidarum]